MMSNNPLAATMLLLGLLAAAPLPAQNTAAVSPTADAQGASLLADFDARITTLAARFEQTVTGADGVVKERASGNLALSRPGRFRWVYETPYEQQIVADGENLWLYDVDLDQVSVRAQAEALGRSPAEILSGAEGALAGFDYQGSYTEAGVTWVQLAAGDADSDFRVIRIGFADGTLAGMQLGDSLGQVTRIVFRDVRNNPEIDPARFDFTPPPGVDVIGTPAGMPGGGETPVTVVPGLG